MTSMLALLLGRERVDADDRRSPASICLLGAVRRLLDLALDEALLDRRQRAAGGLDALEQRARAAFDLVGERLDRVRAGERIDRVGHAGLGGDDLLRAQRDARRLLGRERQRLVAPVAVQRLRAAEHRGERLDRDPDDVVVGLLRGQRAARGLGVEAQLLRRAGSWRRSARA